MSNNELIRKSKKEELKTIALYVGMIVLLGWIVLCRRSIHALFSDDIYLLSAIRNKSFIDFVFNTDSFKLRPVFYAFIYLIHYLCTDDTILLINCVRIMNILLAVFFFFAAYHLTAKRLISFSLSVIFLVSRFAYYQVTMLFGAMEAMALGFSISALMGVLDYLLYNKRKGIVLAIVFYLFAIYTHERYVALSVFLLLGIYSNDNKTIIDSKDRVKYSIAVVIITALFILIRYRLFGSNAWAGTGGTDMLSTFSVELVIKNIMTQLLYLFGWGASDLYLSGFHFTQMPLYVNILTILYDCTIIILIVVYVIEALHDTEYWRKRIILMGLVFIFIGCCILSSSTTIRIEMRWVYVSQAAMLLGIGIFSSFCMKSRNRLIKCISIICCLTIIMSLFIIELNYRKGWNNLYYYQTQINDSLLIDNTVLKYDDLAEHDLIIVDPDNLTDQSYIISQIYAMDSTGQHTPKSVKMIHNLYQISIEDKDDIILYVDNGGYRDLTGTYPKPDIQKTISGLHDMDGWTSQNVEFEITPFITSEYEFVFFSNHPLSDVFKKTERIVNITMNGKRIHSFVMDEEGKTVTLHLKKNKPNNIRIEAGYSYPTLVRGEYELSYVLSIIAK